MNFLNIIPLWVFFFFSLLLFGHLQCHYHFHLSRLMIMGTRKWRHLPRPQKLMNQRLKNNREKCSVTKISMYELIIHFFEFGPRKMPLLPGGELQVILYSINLPLSRSTEKLQTTVSCYTSTDHHHLMHTISTTPVVRCLEWRAHVIIFRCFSNRHQPTLTLRRRWLPIPLPTHISFRTIIIIVITSARGHHHSGLLVARAQNGHFGFGLRYHQFFRSWCLFFFTRKFLSFFLAFGWMVVFLFVVCGGRGDRRRGTRTGNWWVSNECVLMMIDWVLRALGYVNSLA